jgi:DNA-directed RNA polymerase subunit delta
MANKSMVDVAYELLAASKKETSFADLYKAVVVELGMSEEEQKTRIGTFYTDLTLDGRFVALTDNGWDLRARHTYDKVHIDVNDVYSDVEEGDEDEEDEEEEKEYNAEIEGKPVASSEPAESEEENEEAKPLDDDVVSLGIKKDDAY